MENKTVMYQLVDPSQMMSYIMKTKEGKLLVVDGGYDRNAVDIIAKAKELSGLDVPVIEAWIQTHCHNDHCDAFSEIVLNTPEALEIKHVYHNFLKYEIIEQYENSTTVTHTKFYEALAKMPADRITVVQPGDKFSVGSVDFEVMLVPDESITYNVVNESSVVYLMTVEGQKVVFLGDLGEKSGYRLKEAHPDLKCDFVQMSHHGSNGVAFEIYTWLSPKACLWTTPVWLWENRWPHQQYNEGPFETIRLYEHMKSIGVEKHYVCKDGVQEIIFPVEF